MLPGRILNPGPLTYESGAVRLRYAARRLDHERGSCVIYQPTCTTYEFFYLRIGEAQINMQVLPMDVYLSVIYSSSS